MTGKEWDIFWESARDQSIKEDKIQLHFHRLVLREYNRTGRGYKYLDKPKLWKEAVRLLEKGEGGK